MCCAFEKGPDTSLKGLVVLLMVHVVPTSQAVHRQIPETDLTDSVAIHLNESR